MTTAPTEEAPSLLNLVTIGAVATATIVVFFGVGFLLLSLPILPQHQTLWKRIRLLNQRTMTRPRARRRRSPPTTRPRARRRRKLPACSLIRRLQHWHR
jgi:hypothetical protein